MVKFPLWRRFLAAALLATPFGPLIPGVARMEAQSLSIGGLTATIVDERGTPLRDATVTVLRGQSIVRILTTNYLGRITVTTLPPGEYGLLAEQIGFQPVRSIGIPVVPGGTTSLTVKLSHQPPPVGAAVVRQADFTIAGAAPGHAIAGDALREFDRERSATDLTRGLSEVPLSMDGRLGGIFAANGLPARHSRLLVDGVGESLLRHPGLPGEPVGNTLFGRDATEAGLLTTFGPDGEWRGAPGAILSLQSRRGPDHTVIQPWLSGSSASLMGSTLDNPGDSNATSLRGGLFVGGPIRHDTASWAIAVDVQRLNTPSASPFTASVDSAAGGSFAGAITAAAQSIGQSSVGVWTQPTVRSWKGGSGLGRLDWRFGDRSLAFARFGFASWKEGNPSIGGEMINGAGLGLDAQDASGAVGFTTSGDSWISESRVGFHSSRRDWTGAGVPYTGLVGEGVAIGSSGYLPGLFKESVLELSEALTLTSESHRIKVGGMLGVRSSTYDYLPGSAGRYLFGDLASFAAGQGTYYQAVRAGAAPDLSTTEFGVYVQDTWQLTPTFQLFGAARLEGVKLPTDALAISTDWANTTGYLTNIMPIDRKGGVGPRGGFVWDPDGTGRTELRATAGISHEGYDLATFAEAAQFDGGVTVRRAAGAVTWPGTGGSSGATVVGQSLTFFGPDVRQPRAFKGDASLTRRVGHGTTLNITGAYRHTDYLLRRDDLNRPAAPVIRSSFERPIYGSLLQIGGMLTPSVGSNRRFDNFDMAYALTSSGYSQSAGVTVSVERQVTTGLTLLASYTWSKTTDNTPGILSGDPADQLSPFPDRSGTESAWEDGRSDLDIPSRAAVTARYQSSGRIPITLAARFRMQSGLPFTPGFRRGVDANGDGSGGNDPAFIAEGISGMSQLTAATPCLSSQVGRFAERNSCRDPSMRALDLHLAIGLPAGLGRHLSLEVDAFNLASSAMGLFDHAAVLVDPTGALSTNAGGRVVLPLVANPNFGRLLSRRNDPRLLRIGLRVED